MNGFKKYLFLCLTALCLSAPVYAWAQENYYNADEQPAADSDAGEENTTVAPSAHNVVVTSIQKCYAQLSHQEVMDIETNFVKPYEECRKRLAIKLKKKNQLKAGQQKEPAAVKNKKTDDPEPDAQSGAQDTAPPVSGGFFRVQKDPLPPEGSRSQTDNAEASAPSAPAPAPKTGSQGYNLNR